MQEACLHCRDLLESIVLPAAGSQAAAAGLFLVSKAWQEAVQSLDIWRCLEWEVACKVRRLPPPGALRQHRRRVRPSAGAGSHLPANPALTQPSPTTRHLHSRNSTRQGAKHHDEALPALCAALRRWWGARLLDFDASGPCPIARHLLTDATLELVVAAAPRLRGVRLVGCRYVTDAGLKALAAAAPPLQVRCRQARGAGWERFRAGARRRRPATCCLLPPPGAASACCTALTPTPRQAFQLEWAGRGVFLQGLRAVIRACPGLQVWTGRLGLGRLPRAQR